MPELPDVEVFGAYFKRHALNKPIESVTVTSKRIVKVSGIEKKLQGKSFTKVKRHGKSLFISLTKGPYLVMHFGMTGFLYAYRDKNPHQKHSRVIFHFKDSSHLAFVDYRMFGSIKFLEEIPKTLGPDALSISKPAFKALLKKGALKAILMDQKKMAGVGNIYADEICFQAHLLPSHRSETLTEKEKSILFVTMHRVLKKAIQAKAEPSHMPSTWLIHERKKNDPCPACKRPLHKTTVGGRSTYFCAHCQK